MVIKNALYDFNTNINSLTVREWLECNGHVIQMLLYWEINSSFNSVCRLNIALQSQTSEG